MNYFMFYNIEKDLNGYVTISDEGCFCLKQKYRILFIRCKIKCLCVVIEFVLPDKKTTGRSVLSKFFYLIIFQRLHITINV